MIEKFQLSTLSKIDEGRVERAFDFALARLIADCKDRPALDEGRKLSLTITLTPVVGENGELETANATFQVVDTVPKRRSRTYNMKATPSGLLFNEMAPEDVRQTTLDEANTPRKVS